MKTDKYKILGEVLEECSKQVVVNLSSESRTLNDWISVLSAHVGRLRPLSNETGTTDTRYHLIRIAALAIKALEDDLDTQRVGVQHVSQ